MKFSGPTILLLDDDPDDRVLIQEAWEENGLSNELRTFADGEDLMEYLNCRASNSDPFGRGLPSLILLDLNVPKKDGREVLREIKGNPALRSIPIVVLTTSNAEEDILQSYELGANSFIIKPASFPVLVDVVGTLARYWFGIVKLPPARSWANS